jgi:Protein of unknown function (DUF2510)
MSQPGWYPDPYLPGTEQYYDGQTWSGQRRPVGGAAGQPGAEPSAAAGPAEQWSGQPATAADTHDEAETTQGHRLGWQGPDSGAPAPSWQDQPTLQQPAWQDQPTWQDQTAAEQHAAGETAWSSQPAWQQPAWQAESQPPATPYPGQPGWEPRRQSRQRSRRLPIILVLCVVLVAALAVGGWLLTRKSSPAFTFDGKRIDKADQVLSGAESTLTALVTSRHGARNADTRCYYAIPSTPVSGGKKTDVDHAAWCGPVLFVDGDPAKAYLSFALTSTPASGGNLTLNASAAPQSKDPSAPPSGGTLKRPDGKSAPSGSGGLAVPAPPPADKDVLASAPLGSQNVPAAPSGAAIGALIGGVRLTKLGHVSRYGSGDDARSAPAGQQLIAFQTTGFHGNDGDADLSGETTISVDGAAGRAMPSATGSQYVVVAAPTTAKSVEILLSADGVRQTLSLLDGKPGSANIAVLRRTHRTTSVGKSQQITVKYSKTVAFPNGTSGTSQPITVHVTGAALDYAIFGDKVRASSPAKALLRPEITFSDPFVPGQNFALDPGELQFTPAGGTAIRAKDANPDSGRILNYFEVPADITSGALTVTGSFQSTFTNTGETYTTTIATPFSVTLSFPPG